ncbi:hypothetical protein H312_01851 [Anncaliia algerae PRA339]|uniref:RING-type domain-containing protein n=1 Tax=Anncaliia algerae PRA339 TaxID=1288291 RepID=A0A059EYL6_9MICR|nr:hypothetical protein H312_02475 [Anncaliia algerae PRA339]KCZ80752.1 hypothetical protein H312_01851 [Anncaliia algerae PRA339]
MHEHNVLKVLVYCHSCNSRKNDKLFLGDCSHLFCENCINNFEYCKICKDASSFIFIDKEKFKQILCNPTHTFSDSIKYAMFQLNSALNLIFSLKEEITIYKKLLKKAKDEIIMLKKYRNVKKESTDDKFISKRINNIYKRGIYNSVMSEKTNKKSNRLNSSGSYVSSRITLENNKKTLNKRK